MIPSTTMYLGAAAVYAVAFLLLAGWYRRLDGAGTRLCAAAAGFVGLSAVAYAAMGLGLGTVPVAGGVVDVPNLVDDMITYSGLYAITVVLAGASMRWLLTVTGIVAIQRLSFALPNGGIVDGTGMLVAAGIVVAGWFVVVAIFAKPVWRAALDQSPERRLVHWKCRNLVVFLFAMLIVYALIALSGMLTEFLLTSLNIYIDFLMRIGVAAFLFANAGKIGAHEDTDRDSPPVGARSAAAD
ncbi:bacteriorhodopsin [Halobaculum magnesiiphilum]|uniref:Bacteriorhodopsin n=1 Tax=Halobaculum magnesiiphilum TaxID=1017351 RepID=A0A8T8WIY1_9EURY|nr:bacteriorhodopsin [Halobaculum magnesiiphilum]QZP39790.1 bacteriorhodopsin [Halobaculum magnesiiphilum]